MWLISLNETHVQSFRRLHQFARSFLRCCSRRACVLAYLHVVCVCIYVYVCVCSNMYMFCVCVCVYIYVYMCVCVYIYVYEYFCIDYYESQERYFGVLTSVMDAHVCSCAYVCV